MLSLASAVGIEVQSDKIVLATLKKGMRGFSLGRYAVIENFKDRPVADLRNQVQKFVRANGFNRENVILGLPREQVVVRRVELPLDVEENLEQVVQFQVERFEPAEEQKSYFDYSVLKRDEEARKMILQIIMVPRALLDQHLALFRELNLYPAVTRSSSVALHQVLGAHRDGYPRKDPCVILDINPGSLEIVVVTGSDRFFSEKVDLPEEDADENRILTELSLFLSRLHLPGEGLAKIYLCGASADRFLAGLKERFGACELLAAGLNLNGERGMGESPIWLTAAGLAISGMKRSKAARFNLIPPDKRLFGQRASLVPSLVLVVLMVLLGGAMATREYFQRVRLLNQVDAQIEALQPKVAEAMKLREEVEGRQGQLKELAELMHGRERILNVLKDLTERIPDDAFLQNLTIANDRLTLNGYADSASALLGLLQKSPYLKGLTSRNVMKDRVRQDKEKFTFEATLVDPQQADLRR